MVESIIHRSNSFRVRCLIETIPTPFPTAGKASLIELLRAEDAEDVRWLKERRKKPMSFRTLEEFLAERTARA